MESASAEVAASGTIPRMTERDDKTPPLRTSRALASMGMKRAEQSRASHDGTLQRVRRGVYMRAEEWADLNARARFVARAQATRAGRRKPLVFSHVTAGILHDLPLLGPLPDRLDVLMHGVNGGGDPNLEFSVTGRSISPNRSRSDRCSRRRSTALSSMLLQRAHSAGRSSCSIQLCTVIGRHRKHFSPSSPGERACAVGRRPAVCFRSPMRGPRRSPSHSAAPT